MHGWGNQVNFFCTEGGCMLQALADVLGDRWAGGDGFLALEGGRIGDLETAEKMVYIAAVGPGDDNAISA